MGWQLTGMGWGWGWRNRYEDGDKWLSSCRSRVPLAPLVFDSKHSAVNCVSCVVLCVYSQSRQESSERKAG